MEQQRQKQKVKVVLPEKKGYKQWIKYTPLLLGLIVVIIFLSAKGKKEKVGVERIPSVQEKNVIAPDEKKEAQPAGKLTVRIIPDVPTVKQDLEAAITAAGNVTYKWEKNGTVIDGGNTQRLTKDKFKKGDRISVTVTADGEEAGVSIVIKNSPPEIRSVQFNPAHIYRGVDISAMPKGFDADGDEVNYRYQWIINGDEPAMEDKPILKGDRFKRGDTVSVRIIPFDAEDDGEVYTTRPLTIPNGSPRFTSAPPLEFKGFTYAYNAVAEDPDGDAITYSFASAPKDMTIDRITGSIVWQFTKKDEGSHAIEVVAQDNEGMRGFQKYTLTITIPKEEKQ